MATAARSVDDSSPGCVYEVQLVRHGRRTLAMAIPASEFDELKSDLAMAIKSSWFDIGVRHWRWPQQPGWSMNRHLAVAMKSSWFDIKVKHWRWPQRQIILMN